MARSTSIASGFNDAGGGAVVAFGEDEDEERKKEPYVYLTSQRCLRSIHMRDNLFLQPATTTRPRLAPRALHHPAREPESRPVKPARPGRRTRPKDRILHLRPRCARAPSRAHEGREEAHQERDEEGPSASPTHLDPSLRPFHVTRLSGFADPRACASNR